MKILPIRGTHDIYGIDLEKFNIIEEIIKVSANSFGFDEIITPIIESSDLFNKPLGVLQKFVHRRIYLLSPIKIIRICARSRFHK